MVENVQTIELSPLFITGMWRSGTTLISRMINNHPEFDVTYDTVHFLRFSFNRYNPISDKKNVRALISDTKERLKKRYQLEFSVEEVLDDLSGTPNYASLYDSIMKNLLLKKSGKETWGEKTNLAWSNIPDFLEMYPQGRVIHIIRDPRAVLLSWKKFTNAPGNDYLDSVLNSYDSMAKAVEFDETYKSKRYVNIIYEELVTDPCGTIQRACHKLEIDYLDKMIDQPAFTDMHGKSWKSNSVHGQNMSGIYTDTLDKWKHGLNEWEIAFCEIITCDLLNKFGYEKERVNYKRSVINEAISELTKSNLAAEGLIRFLLTGDSFERYPSDPTDEKNWKS